MSRDVHPYELEPAWWLCQRMTKLMAQFDVKFGTDNNRPVDLYLDGTITLKHDGHVVGRVVPNDFDEWSYRPGVDS